MTHIEFTLGVYPGVVNNNYPLSISSNFVIFLSSCECSAGLSARVSLLHHDFPVPKLSDTSSDSTEDGFNPLSKDCVLNVLKIGDVFYESFYRMQGEADESGIWALDADIQKFFLRRRIIEWLMTNPE